MKKLIVLLILATPAFAAIDTITSSVCFQDVQGVCVANGSLTLELSNVATLTTNGQVVPILRSVGLTAGGMIPANTSLWGNDQLTPSGTVYYAKLYDSNGTLVADYSNCPWSISGSSPIDLSALVCTSAGASYPAAVLQQPTGNQTISGGYSLTLTGPLVSVGITDSGTSAFKVLNAIRFADQFTGADACVKITAALADLPAAGGTVDARGLTGAQSCTGLTVTTGQTVLLGATVLTTTGTITVTGNGARLVGLPPNLPGNAPAMNTSSVLKLDSGAASGTAVVNVRNASNAIVENLGIDANSVASAIGVLYDSTVGQQGSTHGTFRNLDIRNAHQCFVDGDPSETETANSKQADYFVLDNWTCFGNGTDLTSEGFHINNGFGGEASVVSRGGIGVVNKGIHIVLGGAYARYEGNTSTSGVGTNPEFISLDATAYTGGLFVNNHTENTGWTYALHDASCGDGGSHLGYNRPVILMNNHWGHPVLVDGCNSDISIGNVGSSNTITWTVGGTASVQSVGDTIYLTTTLPWTVSGSGQVYRWGQDGKLLTNNITFTTGSSQITSALADGGIDLNSTVGGTGGVRINRLGGTGGFTVYKGNTTTVNFSVPDTGAATLPNGITLGGGATITKHLSAAASLDFAAWAGADCQDLTITVTGAVDGNTVELGVPSALSSTAGVQFTGFVSAADTVTVRGCKVTAGASANPAAATVRADVWAH